MIDLWGFIISFNIGLTCGSITYWLKKIYEEIKKQKQQ